MGIKNLIKNYEKKIEQYKFYIAETQKAIVNCAKNIVKDEYHRYVIDSIVNYKKQIDQQEKNIKNTEWIIRDLKEELGL